MKVLFLDMDGVLNSAPFFKVSSKRAYRRCRAAMKHGPDARDAIDLNAVARLNAVVAATGCKVVISSSWRLNYSPGEMGAILFASGFAGEVIDATPVTIALPVGVEMHERGHEIAAWIEVHPEVTTFAIVDDGDDMAHLRHRLVRTSWDTGLLDEHADQLIDLLQGTP